MPLASWIQDLFTPFTDATFYFVMAAVGTVFFSIRLALMLFVGIDDGGDFDVDADADAGGGGIEGHGVDFSLFSMISILSFMMGAGWLGLAARLDWGVGPVLAAVYAGSFGFSLMLLSSLALWQMRKLSQPTIIDMTEAIGRTGTVYMRIPGSEEGGRGKVKITVGGRQREVDAVSRGAEIASFTAVRVVEMRDDGTYVVEVA